MLEGLTGVIGMIPGVGGQVAGIVAYDQAKKFSKYPEKYGTGVPDGVVAAESANNAMVGPSLVPLLTLSIPGSPTAAVLLGGLLIHGIFPGPNLFLLHGSLVNTFIGALLLAQTLMLLFGIILSRYSYWVMRVPDLYMAASIIVLAVFGTYSVNNSFNDVIIMFSVGIVMYIASKFGFSPAPVVMGLILGGIAENSFLKGMLIASTGEGFIKYFFTGWINIITIILCIVSILFGVLSTLKDRHKKRIINKYDIVVSLIVTIGSFSIYKFALNVKDPLSAIFPAATLIIMAGLSLILFVQVLISMISKKKLHTSGVDIPLLKVFILFVYTIGYFYSLNCIGFYLSSFIFYAIFPFLFSRAKDTILKDIPVKLVISCIFMGILYFLFNLILKVQTPTGLFI